ncbi:hypothetical protein CCZ01_07050 [Helicobacter monodelphidis]|uniref:PhzF family phenazine biosynthesis protein n=1 Tax=Helicobacter sp. 15-1451 TaxID=2004995 RepID=UPI000DCB0028|nr:PhzF family phenazine biosynthesis protein [Helicobacter sp. 15-1451]RAX57094.1 hypothetical protein CCZ01_07050 [Helicobacter sp. 15-1451]
MKSYYIDVFVDEENNKNGGNPCLVYTGAECLDKTQMQSLAQEAQKQYGGIETAFILPPQKSNNDYMFMYFAPLKEMEMCVHASIAALSVLEIESGNFHDSTLMKTYKIETKLGIFEMGYNSSTNQGYVLQNSPQILNCISSSAEVADALNITNSTINQELPIQNISTSRPKLIVPIQNVEFLDNLQPNFNQLWKLCDTYHTSGLYPFAFSDDFAHSKTLFARQFPNNSGYNEDSATGVAASALACYIASHCHILRKGWQSFIIKQGIAMGKPSKIIASVNFADEKIIKTKISGKVAIRD